MPTAFIEDMPPRGPPVGLNVDSYYLAACSLPLEASKNDIRLREEVFRKISGLGGGCDVISPAEVGAWLQKDVLHGDWMPIVSTSCRALWQASNKRHEQYSDKTRFILATALRTLFITFQRLTDLYVKVGATSPTEPRFLSFSEFQNLTALLSDWGHYIEDPYDTFREAGATDTPGGSLLPLKSLATYCLEVCTVHIPDAGIPEEDWVILAPAAIVRETRSLTSPQVYGEIAGGTIVRICDIVGRRALLSKPCKGWVSLKTRRGQDIMEPVDTEHSEEEAGYQNNRQWELHSPPNVQTNHVDPVKTPSDDPQSAEPEPLPHDSVPLPSAYPEEEPDFTFHEIHEIPSPSVVPPVPSPRSHVRTVMMANTVKANEVIVQHKVLPVRIDRREQPKIFGNSAYSAVTDRGSERSSEPLPRYDYRMNDELSDEIVPNTDVPKPAEPAKPLITHIEHTHVQTQMVLRRGSGTGSDSGRCYSPPSRSASGHLNFTKPTQSACFKIQDPKSGQADFKKYPWDFTGECQPLPTAKLRRGAKEQGILKYAFGKPVQRSMVGSAAFKSTTPRGAMPKAPESGDLGPGAYQPDSRQKKVHTRSHSQGASFTSSKRDLLSAMTGGKVQDAGGKPAAREGRSKEPAIFAQRSNTPSYMQPLRREVDENKVKKVERGSSATAAKRAPSGRKPGGPGFGSSVKRELPLTRGRHDP